MSQKNSNLVVRIKKVRVNLERSFIILESTYLITYMYLCVFGFPLFGLVIRLSHSLAGDLEEIKYMDSFIIVFVR